MNRYVTLRPAEPQELAELSQLCLRSKAYWGYDDTFIAACVPELTLTTEDLKDGLLIVAEIDGVAAGIGQVAYIDEGMEIDRLFVDPDFIGSGCGRVLFDWCVEAARAQGATRLMIEADPEAAQFYEKMGAVRIGHAPSGAIPGRMLPLLELKL